MTIQHILYIPTIFLLGLVFGVMINERRRGIAINPPETVSQDYPFRYKTSGKKLFQTFLIFLLVFLITHLFEIPWGPKAVSQLLGGMEIFDKRPVFSDIEVYEQVKRFSTEGLIAYTRFTYTTDVVFPLSLLAFLLTLARFVSQRITIPKYRANVLVSLPWFWFGCDMVENAVIFSILSNFPDQSKVLASLLGPVTTLKFGLLVLSVFIPSLLFTFKKRTGVAKKNHLAKSRFL